MPNPNQPMNGPNGSYNICGHCGTTFGTPPGPGIGMWEGVCYICGRKTGLANALHDFDMTDQEVLVVKRAQEVIFRMREVRHGVYRGLPLDENTTDTCWDCGRKRDEPGIPDICAEWHKPEE